MRSANAPASPNPAIAPGLREVFGAEDDEAKLEPEVELAGEVCATVGSADPEALASLVVAASPDRAEVEIEVDCERGPDIALDKPNKGVALLLLEEDTTPGGEDEGAVPDSLEDALLVAEEVGSDADVRDEPG